MTEKLAHISLSENNYHCKNMDCSVESHSSKWDNHIQEVLFSLIESSFTSIPLSDRRRRKKGRGNRVLPGWSAELENMRQRSKQAYHDWNINGRPRAGELFESKQTSHAQF